ncbi:MAG: FAD synthetase family protein [Chloroflexi bacterium]|nr:FAD synthetase family protein [Chloroflexota bacterium]
MIHEVADRARALGLCSLAVTFEPHPEQILFPERKLSHLSTSAEKVEILHANGMDDVWICPFTTELARLEPDDFMRMVAERQPISELWVGADFALGRGRRGTISVLAEIGSAMGWGLHMVPPLMLEGQVVSSTAIRTLLSAGAVRGAADLLGRPYGVSGELVGDDLIVDPLRALPKPMGYEAQLRQGGVAHDVPVTVLSTPNRIRLETPVPHQAGHGAIDFLRRTD